MNLKKYITELKRRNVFKAAIAYLIVAWLVAQVASIFLPAFNAPPFVLKTILFILIIGFPLNLIFAWVYDITSDGVIKTQELDKDKSIAPKTANRLNKVIIASLSLVVILLLYNQFLKPSNPKEEKVENVEISKPIKSERKSIAVLPLFNVNKDNKLEYFSDGVTQEIIDELAKINQFMVSAFSSTRIYKNTNKNSKEIATELDVSLILNGTTRIYGDSVRLSIELVDPNTGNLIWREQYDDVLSNTIKIQNNIARQVVEKLNVELSQEEKIKLDKINTNNPEAFDLFLKAKAEYTTLTKESIVKSIAMLERVIELDPDYAQAYTLLAWIHILNGFAEVVPGADSAINTISKALPLIEKSISLDPTISDNYLIMGSLDLFYLNNLPKAKENVERALNINSWPKIPTNYCICSAISVYAALGKLEKASELVKLSKITDRSNYFVFSDEGLTLLLKGDYEQAIYAFKQAAEFNDIPYFNYNIGMTYYHVKDYKNALLFLNKANGGETEPIGYFLAYLSNTYFKMGNTEKSNHYRNMILKRQSDGKSNLNIPLAMISVGREKTEEALHYLERAYIEKEYGFAWFLNIDPLFNKLKDNTKFIELNEKIGFDQ